ncbi:MAG: hypothetical protein KJ697_04065 [Nanoarchaeota archaeon]|nr:hypothetical protein [Nanoarchaeota archaeon]MBU4123905.1 hypothetical protein [Nanoarchaeota archaeon]
MAKNAVKNIAGWISLVISFLLLYVLFTTFSISIITLVEIILLIAFLYVVYTTILNNKFTTIFHKK